MGSNVASSINQTHTLELDLLFVFLTDCKKCIGGSINCQSIKILFLMISNMFHNDFEILQIMTGFTDKKL